LAAGNAKVAVRNARVAVMDKATAEARDVVKV